MPAYLKQDAENDLLYIELKGMKSDEFQEALANTRKVTGRSWNPREKRWELPNDAATALEAMQKVGPTPDAATASLLRRASEEIATQLLTRVGDDAELKLSWAERLYPYQRSGVDFLAEHPHCLLADQMGLGKTVEAIGAIEEWQLRQSEQVEGPSLVIAPKVLRKTWATEIEQWTGDESTQIIDARTPAKRLVQLDEPANYYIINWEAFWREPVLPALAKRDWLAVIADEAHRAKNRKSKQSKGLRKLKAPVQIAATGTPIMNTPDELWALLAWLRPETYTSFWAFHNSYVDEFVVAHRQRVMVGVKNADKLRFELRDKMMRRRKTDVLTDLPDKLPSQIIEVELSPAERRLYNEVNTALVLDVSAWIEAQADEAGDTGGDREKFVAKRAEELADMPLERLKGLVPNAGARLAKLRQITAAAKAVVCDELIREEPDTPVVAFTWHVDAARQLAAALSKGSNGLRVGTIAGSDDSDPVKDAFQAGDLDHLVCTIAKGGVGLTLTRSSNPILVEEDWVPDINEQAIDRTHRLGQTEPVTPRVLRVVDSVDDGKVAPKLEFKKSIVEAVLGA